MKITCSICKRFCEISGEASDELSISHGFCARCSILQYADAILGDTMEDPESGETLVDDREAKSFIEAELEAGIEWQGDDQSDFNQAEQEIFERLLIEVRTKREARENKEMDLEPPNHNFDKR